MRTPTATHWGNYDVVTENGELLALEPSAKEEAHVHA